MADSVEGAQALFALLIAGMGALEVRGDLIWSHWEGMDDGGMRARRFEVCWPWAIPLTTTMMMV